MTERRVSDIPPAVSLPARWAVWRAEQEHAKANGWEPNELNVDTLLTDEWRHDGRLTLARYIEAHEQPPVDPAILAVREICATISKDGHSERWLSGELDKNITNETLDVFRRHAATLAEQPTG